MTNLTTQRNALKMLYERIDLIVRYLENLAQGACCLAVSSLMPTGKAPHDPETLRQISALKASLPAASSLEFEQELMTVRASVHRLAGTLQEKTDVMLTSYLSTLTESLIPLNQVRRCYRGLADPLQLLDRAVIVATQNERGERGGGGGRRPGGGRSLRDRAFDF